MKHGGVLDSEPEFEDEFTTYKLSDHAAQTVFCEATLNACFVNDEGITRNLTIDKHFDGYDAQWALNACRSEGQAVEPEKKARLEDRYAAAFQMAKERRVLEFIRDSDYYVLAKPGLTLLWRICRQNQVLFKKL